MDDLVSDISKLRARAVSSVELLDEYLRRIETADPLLHSFLTVDGERARIDAKEIDRARARGEPVGLLEGVPIAVKDNIDTANLRTTCGSQLFATRVPSEDATIVRKLRRNGAILLGKLALDEFAYGATGLNAHFGRCRSPWNLDRITGGSSSGAGSAVAGRLCAAAIGTDTGGSARIPAALNGICGLRPTHGVVSRFGTYPLSWSLDTVGPLAHSVRDLALLLSCIAGRDDRDTASIAVGWRRRRLARRRPGLSAPRVGIVRDYFFEDLDSDVETATARAIEMMVELHNKVTEVAISGVLSAADAAVGIARVEAYAIHEKQLLSTPDAYGAAVRERLLLGKEIPGAQYARYRNVGSEWGRTLDKVFREVDVLLMPCTPRVAPWADEVKLVETTTMLTRNTYCWSLIGLPALVIPCGVGPSGMPVGLQLVAARNREDVLFRLGLKFQAETPHLVEPPTLANVNDRSLND